MKNPADPNEGPDMQKIVSLFNGLDHEHQNMCPDFNILRMRPWKPNNHKFYNCKCSMLKNSGLPNGLNMEHTS